MKKFLIIILLLAAALWGGWKWYSGKKSATMQAWQKVEVTLGDIVIGVQATGNVQPQNRVAIKAPVPGRIEQVLVREGDWVKRGQILAWMSSGDRASLLDAARAKGPEELKRWEDLYKATPLIAPITGTIISRAAESGQNVSTSDSPLVVSDRLIFKAQVDETDVAKVKLGQKVKVTMDAYPDQPVLAVVDHIAFEARTVSNVTIYDIDVLPRKVPAFMRSGMTANAMFQIEAHEGVLTLPAEAIQNDGSGSYVYVPAPRSPTAQAEPNAAKAGGDKQGRKKDWAGAAGQGMSWKQGAGAGQGGGSREFIPQSQPLTRSVETGLSDGAKVEIVSGLEEGQRVLIKAVALPSAAGGSNPLMMARPGANRAPRGANR